MSSALSVKAPRLFRSEDMELLQLVISHDVAHDTVDALGHLGVLQFKDLNPDVNALQRNFVAEVKRLDDMERKLAFLEQQCNDQEIEFEVPHMSPTDDCEVETQFQAPNSLAALAALEQELIDLERDAMQMNVSHERLERSIHETIERIHVLGHNQEFFEREVGMDMYSPLLQDSDSSALGMITGVIEQGEKMDRFQHLLWQVSHGNVFFRYAEIPERVVDPLTGVLQHKNTFTIFVQGGELHQRIRKLCQSYAANVYDVPEENNERLALLNHLREQLQQEELILEKNTQQRDALLRDIATSLVAWRVRITKEKSIYHTMNLFIYEPGQKVLIADGWCPRDRVEEVHETVSRVARHTGAGVPVMCNPVAHTETPPTHFLTNKFTFAFHHIVEAYGVARYKEVNPSVFTLITFPFLFGVMFGDIGHGTIMLIFSSFLIYKEKEFLQMRLNEMVDTCFQGRYLIFLMSLYSIYCGFLYNECFSFPLGLFGPSGWLPPPPENDPTICPPIDGNQAYTTQDLTHVYPFGVDPAWKGVSNEILFYNSLKMKMSIILGVTQMTLGIILSCYNHVYFHKRAQGSTRAHIYAIFFEFIPQLIILLGIFGYMSFLIVYKWTVNWHEMQCQCIPTPEFDGMDCSDTKNTNKFFAPRLLNTMIDMFLSPGKVSSTDTVFWNPTQHLVQVVMLLLVVAAIPVMLLVKPLLLRHDHKKKETMYQVVADEVGEEEEFDFGELMVHQFIHTIEFVLGTVSNTASYLRLWALSLAHSELSTVFSELVLLFCLKRWSVAGPFIGFAVWAALTFAVLMIMESLSAFLHALRLHWVEFQNKFYYGDGYKFLPFNYERLLNDDED
mmetsp:Transcript_23793/g.59537  ORF Transcript_23793/g.59537 Transcript_23793/m.59537 type:complete len:845 (-) Transcript_23793:30-2564(-)|eukprot:CAMPEP_0177683404 /NCGR_PEP_ID=MMETSP0447-20121125/31786_1 /TAXON_ID=0 /ORGANISM="Stygamoeba regulata, Strain BSH-02190019" /LENGTH=844 /DNA_ID=CAMNT_0019192995 /DNA_START=215 /DNA_END=2749 /DNA_ORIENTATION=-